MDCVELATYTRTIRKSNCKILVVRVCIIEKLNDRLTFDINFVAHALADIEEYGDRKRRILGREVLVFPVVLSSSKRVKFCLFNAVTGRFLESFTVTGTIPRPHQRAKICHVDSARAEFRIASPEDGLRLPWLFCGKMCTSSGDCPCAKQSDRNANAHEASRRSLMIRIQPRLFFMAFESQVGHQTACTCLKVGSLVFMAVDDTTIRRGAMLNFAQ